MLFSITIQESLKSKFTYIEEYIFYLLLKNYI